MYRVLHIYLSLISGDSVGSSLVRCDYAAGQAELQNLLHRQMPHPFLRIPPTSGGFDLLPQLHLADIDPHRYALPAGRRAANGDTQFSTKLVPASYGALL